MEFCYAVRRDAVNFSSFFPVEFKFSGKTLLAKAVANEAGLNFISVKGPELLNMVSFENL